MRGQAAMKTGNTAAALKDFGALAKLKPNDADIQYTYGTTALSQGLTSEGINALARASQLAPKDAGKKRAYIQALIKKGRESRDKATKKDAYGKAAVLARELVAIDPSYDSQILKISAELGAGLYPQAIETGKAAVAKKGNDWLAHYYLGQAYTSAEQYAAGEAPLNKAKELTSKPDDLRLIWRQLGFTYEKQKKYAQSIEAYQFAGDQGGVARVKKNEETDRFNKLVEEENKAIKAMEEEAKKLEEELKALESGGGGGL
jgi:tetratricopeptide (TPR) repeat protein